MQVGDMVKYRPDEQPSKPYGDPSGLGVVVRLSKYGRSATVQWAKTGQRYAEWTHLIEVINESG